MVRTVEQKTPHVRVENNRTNTDKALAKQVEHGDLQVQPSYRDHFLCKVQKKQPLAETVSE